MTDDTGNRKFTRPNDDDCLRRGEDRWFTGTISARALAMLGANARSPENISVMRDVLQRSFQEAISEKYSDVDHNDQETNA